LKSITHITLLFSLADVEKVGFVVWGKVNMIKYLVFTLILTMIFPAHCFATFCPTFPTEQEIVEQIMLIIEDGEVEGEEMISFIEGVTSIEAISTCTLKASGVVLITLLLTQLDFTGSSLEILLDVIILYYGTWFIVVLGYLAAYGCDTGGL
jgi:hypothetical protein